MVKFSKNKRWKNKVDDIKCPLPPDLPLRQLGPFCYVIEKIVGMRGFEPLIPQPLNPSTPQPLNPSTPRPTVPFG